MVGKRRIPLNTDFRAALSSLLAFEDSALTAQDQHWVLLRNLFPDLPNDLSADEWDALQERAGWYLNGGHIPTGENEDGEPRVYSFGKDAALIFAAFRQTHGIDLQTERMHWWSFLALFMDLGSETAFCQLVALRKRVKTGKATKEERATARELGALFELPEIDERTVDERETDDAFLRRFEQGRQLRAQAQ